MPAAQFGRLTIDDIARGLLKQKLDERLCEASDKLAAYVTQGGLDLTRGAKAEVTLKIVMKHVEQGIFTVKGDVSDKAPSVPLPATDRLVLSEENGQAVLFMNLAPEITPQDDPRQTTFTPPNRDRKDM